MDYRPLKKEEIDILEMLDAETSSKTEYARYNGVFIKKSMLKSAAEIEPYDAAKR